MLSLFRDQPRAFTMIFMLEIWERFGFYIVQGVLILYFIRYLGFDEHQAYYAFGAYSALLFGFIAVGGYLGDRVLGTKRCIVLGLATLATGYLALSLTDREHVFLALGLVCVGNGLFKANPSSLLSKCYEKDDPRLHSAFTLYYIAINLGSTFALFLGPTISTRYGYPYAYFLGFIGLLLGLANYLFQRGSVRDINTAADKRVVPLWQWLMIVALIALTCVVSSFLLQHADIIQGMVWLMIALALLLYARYWRQENPRSQQRMLVALILMSEALVFFILYQQMPTSLNLFAVNNVRPYLFGWHLDPQAFQMLNPVWIMVIGPLLAMLYNKLNQKGIHFAMPYKFSLGMICCGLSFSLLFFARFCHDEQGLVSSGWLLASYFLQSSGELLVSALGLAMVAELVPTRITGFVMGLWFLIWSAAGFLGAHVASLTALPEQAVPGLDSLWAYTRVFAAIGVVTLVIGGVMWWTSGRLNACLENKA